MGLLTLLFLLLAVIALGTLACVPGRGDAVTIACRVVSGACAAAGLAALAGGAAPASLTLPFGLPGEAFVFSVDVVSLAFLPAVGVALAADGRPALAAGALLFLCAGDAALSVVGASLAALAAGWRGAVPVLALLLALGLLSLLPGGAVLPQDALAALRVPGQATPVLLLAAVPGLMLAGSVRGGAALPCLGFVSAGARAARLAGCWRAVRLRAGGGGRVAGGARSSGGCGGCGRRRSTGWRGRWAGWASCSRARPWGSRRRRGRPTSARRPRRRLPRPCCWSGCWGRRCRSRF